MLNEFETEVEEIVKNQEPAVLGDQHKIMGTVSGKMH
jgi:translation initiation factor IF-1